MADVEAAFARIWVESGGAAIPEAERTAAESIPACGEVSLRVVASVPWTAGILRMDQLVASAAVQKLWLTDAYFAGTPPYVEALRAAALDGVDVRLLVPGGSDIPILQPLTHAGYRPLLEAGVRVFEWRGPMLHAKTAVADGRWARVGSSNLNLASWIGNYELDVSVEHAGFATEMERAFQADLESSDEIVLSLRPRRASRTRGEKRSAPGRSGSASRAAVGALRVGNTVGAAISNQRLLGHSQARMVTLAGLALLLLVGLTAFFPRWLTIPGLLLGTWVGLALLVRGIGLFWKRRRQQIPKTRVVVAKAAPQGRAP